jgi:hypothetical protein
MLGPRIRVWSTPVRCTRRQLLVSTVGAVAWFETGRTAGLNQSTEMHAPTTGLKQRTPMNHVVLLGDSIFDNAAYVAGGPDVVTQLRERMQENWQATLGAVDGAVTTDVIRQLHNVPHDATHLIVSVGGNDALGEAHFLDDGARSVAQAISSLASIRETFDENYRTMLDAVLRLELPTALCTIYDGRLPDPQRRRLAVTALCAINDCITRQAFSHGLPLVDLRLICNEDDDYANPIEPSVQGGAKIAAAIVSTLVHHEFGNRRSEVFIT